MRVPSSGLGQSFPSHRTLLVSIIGAEPVHSSELRIKMVSQWCANLLLVTDERELPTSRKGDVSDGMEQRDVAEVEIQLKALSNNKELRTSR